MLQYQHLLGLEFDIERQNCWTIVRQFYRANWDIQLPDYPCPTDWWAKGLDLYASLAAQTGFDIIHDHPRDWKAGDVIVMAIQSSTGNHAAVVLDNGNILHHLVGQRSVVTSYGGLFRNSTVGVYRYRDLPKTSTVHTVQFRELDLPPHVRRRVEAIEEARSPTAEEVGAGG